MRKSILTIGSFNLEFWAGLKDADFAAAWNEHGLTEKFPKEKAEKWQKDIKAAFEESKKKVEK